MRVFGIGRARTEPVAVLAAVAPEKPRDRRQVSGQRVLCRCTLKLPKLDPFSAFRVACEGYMILNVRGGSLYLPSQFSEEGAARAFPPDRSLPIKGFTLYPPTGEPLVLGDLSVRYLKLLRGSRLDGLVLRFVGLDERQLDLLNALPALCPSVDGPEEDAIPLDGLFTQSAG